MRNKLAIVLTLTLFTGCLLALGVTIAAVWPDESRPVASGVEAFTPAEIGQTRPNKPMPRNFIGPQLPDEEQAERGDDEQRPTPPTPPQPTKTNPPKKSPPKGVTWKPAVLHIVTNFEQADVKVNGMPYPEYSEPGEPEGMVLPAGGPYNVEVKFGANTKVYNVNLRPNETRLLLVELSGYNSGAPPAPQARKPAPAKKEEPKKEEEKEEKKDGGKITVYSKPAGVVIVDGKESGEKTPGSVDLDTGRHEVQVKYESGSISEKKIVRVRNGSRIKLFFRERSK